MAGLPPPLVEELDQLLKGPAPPNCTSQPIDFAKSKLPEYATSFALLIHNLLTPAECASLLSAAESTTSSKWEQAMVNIGQGKQMMILDSRNCGRIIWDITTLASRLQDRIMPHLPAEIVTLKGRAHITGNGPAKRKEIWRISQLNFRLRFLKYTAGMYFREHCDGSYVTPDGKEISFLTVHLYLNGTPPAPPQANNESTTTAATASKNAEQPLQGGATRFFFSNGKRTLDVVPETGACLVFQHRGLIHSGDDVVAGTKYTMRTDIMYEKVGVGE